jgi:hypothetical protein
MAGFFSSKPGAAAQPDPASPVSAKPKAKDRYQFCRHGVFRSHQLERKWIVETAIAIQGLT